MARFLSSSNATVPTGATRLSHIVEFTEKGGLDRLLIGLLEDSSNDLYIERYCYKMDPVNKKTNMGSLSRHVLCKARLEKAWWEVSKDTSIPMETRYKDLLQLNYGSSAYSPISRQLHPLLKGIIEKKKRRDRYDDSDDEGWADMYDDFDSYNPFGSDEE
jgi:hypothetical protein